MSITPRFVALETIILDYSRVILNLQTTDFPSPSNVALNFDLPNLPVDDNDNDNHQPHTNNSNSLENSPYPNIELSLLDKDDRLIAQATIIEHREKAVSLTLHIRRPQPNNTYTAQADMVYNQKIIHSISTPFILKLPQEDIE